MFEDNRSEVRATAEALHQVDVLPDTVNLAVFFLMREMVVVVILLWRRELVDFQATEVAAEVVHALVVVEEVDWWGAGLQVLPLIKLLEVGDSLLHNF